MVKAQKIQMMLKPVVTCHGAGQVRMQQGFFSVQQTCSTCRGQGKIIKNPCNKCHGSGVSDRQQTLEVTIPAGVDNGDRVRLTGKGEAIRDGQIRRLVRRSGGA